MIPLREVGDGLSAINPHKPGIWGLWKILWETLRVFFNKPEEDLRDCGVFESIILISSLPSLICTSPRYIAPKRGIVTPGRL